MTSAHKRTESYTVHPYLQRRWRHAERKLAFSVENVADWADWRERTISKLRSVIGCDSMTRAPLEPRITEELDLGDHTRQRVEVQTEPGVVMPVYVLIPKGTRPPYPVVLAPHGHSSGGKYAVAGRRDIPEVARTIVGHNYDYGVQFVRAGFITFCPDARGFGERQEEEARGDILKQSCQFISRMALPLGQSVLGMWVWDMLRLVDYVHERDDCRPASIGSAGLSGGGKQTLWAAAFDQRIKCAVISGHMYGYKESMLDRACCPCNNVPQLFENVDMGDVGALIAPRPMLVETGNQDPLNGASGLANVYSQMDIVRSAYRLLGAEDLLQHDVFDGGHRWNGVKAIPWMKRHIA